MKGFALGLTLKQRPWKNILQMSVLISIPNLQRVSKSRKAVRPTAHSESEGDVSEESSSQEQRSSTSDRNSDYLPEKSTSSLVTSDNRISDRHFLDREIKLLKTPLALDDCPVLSTALGICVS